MTKTLDTALHAVSNLAPQDNQRPSREQELETVRFVLAKTGLSDAEWQKGMAAFDRLIAQCAGFERLRDAIRTYLNGDFRAIRRRDTCAHFCFGFEICQSCIDEHFARALAAIDKNMAPR